LGHACGVVTEFAMFEVLPAALAADWRLTLDMKAAMDRRESATCMYRAEGRVAYVFLRPQNSETSHSAPIAFRVSGLGFVVFRS